MLVRRAPQPAMGLLLASSLAGCTRASFASLLPTLEVGVVAQRQLDARMQLELDHGQRRWGAVAFVALSFRPVRPASQLPLRAELAPEAWLAPCDEDDVECLQEASAAEHEIAAALGELQ
jgi:hypothetical protein